MTSAELPEKARLAKDAIEKAIDSLADDPNYQGPVLRRIDGMHIDYATEVGEQTCLGVPPGPFPLKGGNCFSVITTSGKYYKIVNFNLENWDEMLRRGIALPVKVGVLDDGHAVIHDERIPDDWYRDSWCEVCCPERLLPITQRLEHDRQKACGSRVECHNVIELIPSKAPSL